MIRFMIQKPFSKKVLLSKSIMENLLVDLPKLDQSNKFNLLDINEEKF